VEVRSPVELDPKGIDVPVHHEGRAAHPSLVLCLLRITLLKDLLDHGLDQVGGNGKVDASGRGVGLAIFGTREGDADELTLQVDQSPAAITGRSDPPESLHVSVQALGFERGAKADLGEETRLTCQRAFPRTPLRRAGTPVVPR
jgi:hypothetical protein